MKSIQTLLLLIWALSSFAQSSVVIKPTAMQAFNSVVSFPFASTASLNNPVDLVAAFWSGNSTNGAWRSFFKMDLSSVPSGAIIDSAFFTLYADNSSLWGNPSNPNFGSDNSAFICKITSPYTTSLIDWSSQPSYTFTNAAVLDQSVLTTQDYLHVDATDLIQNILATSNNGFAFVMQHELSTYNSQIFYSSACPDESKRPSLKIYYHMYPTQASWFEEVNSMDIRLSANQNSFMVNCNKLFSGQAAIYDMQGRVISFANAFNQKVIMFQKSNMPTGIYLLKLNSKDFAKIMKVMIE